MIHWAVILPLLFFLIIIFGIGIWANRQVVQSNSFYRSTFRRFAKWVALFWQ